MIVFDFTGQKKANSKNKKNQIKRNAAKKMPTNSFGDTLFDKIYQIMEKHKEVSCWTVFGPSFILYNNSSPEMVRLFQE